MSENDMMDITANETAAVWFYDGSMPSRTATLIRQRSFMGIVSDSSACCLLPEPLS
jgi:hypothetical protein